MEQGEVRQWTDVPLQLQLSLTLAQANHSYGLQLALSQICSNTTQHLVQSQTKFAHILQILPLVELKTGLLVWFRP
jgi:hypothetical protein